MNRTKGPDYGFLKGASLLITGGTGSFGRALTKELLMHAECRRIIIFSRDEWKQWEMREKEPLFNDPSLRFFLGDVRDRDRLRRACYDVDYVVHAAALKQVPAAEYNPTEFVQTNINGAVNVVSAAIDMQVKGVIALSTDKAVNPVNLYGATKLCSDKVFIAGNVYVGRGKSTFFSVVRYGNVLGSRGSLIPHWKSLLAAGAKRLPITDLRMTRFWITLEDSVKFVLKSLQRSCGGELFIPKIPSMRIVDVAKALCDDVELDIIGIRPGEKLHEILISEDEARHTFAFDDCYLILPDRRKEDKAYLKQVQKANGKGTLLPEDFRYASNTNDSWITVEALKKLL